MVTLIGHGMSAKELRQNALLLFDRQDALDPEPSEDARSARNGFRSKINLVLCCLGALDLGSPEISYTSLLYPSWHDTSMYGKTGKTELYILACSTGRAGIGVNGRTPHVSVSSSPGPTHYALPPPRT